MISLQHITIYLQLFAICHKPYICEDKVKLVFSIDTDDNDFKDKIKKALSKAIRKTVEETVKEARITNDLIVVREWKEDVKLTRIQVPCYCVKEDEQCKTESSVYEIPVENLYKNIKQQLTQLPEIKKPEIRIFIL